jgi:hypothetical protein
VVPRSVVVRRAKPLAHTAAPFTIGEDTFVCLVDEADEDLTAEKLFAKLRNGLAFDKTEEIGSRLLQIGAESEILLRLDDDRESASLLGALARWAPALHRVERNRILDSLVKLAKHPSAEVRYSVVNALEAFTDYQLARETLHALMRDQDATIRQIAGDIVADLG